MIANEKNQRDQSMREMFADLPAVDVPAAFLEKSGVSRSCGWGGSQKSCEESFPIEYGVGFKGAGEYKINDDFYVVVRKSVKWERDPKKTTPMHQSAIDFYGQHYLVIEFKCGVA
jgi:hypothetical protein